MYSAHHLLEYAFARKTSPQGFPIMTPDVYIRPPLAVSPINEVRRVLDYAVTEIPPEKILMGMPNYGYDWTLPFMRGTPAQSVSLTQAVDLALRYGVEIQFDEQAQTPYFYYTDNGTQHVVWFDDPRSIDASFSSSTITGLPGRAGGRSTGATFRTGWFCRICTKRSNCECKAAWRRYFVPCQTFVQKIATVRKTYLDKSRDSL